MYLVLLSLSAPAIVPSGFQTSTCIYKVYLVIQTKQINYIFKVNLKRTGLVSFARLVWAPRCVFPQPQSPGYQHHLGARLGTQILGATLASPSASLRGAKNFVI